tara:strand:- start:47 stop:373 length:327 start_codon:yes stop_codon:yes gene_type:complete
MTCLEKDCGKDIELTDVEGHYSGMCHACRDRRRFYGELNLKEDFDGRKGGKIADGEKTKVFATFKEGLFLTPAERVRGTHRWEHHLGKKGKYHPSGRYSGRDELGNDL